eukprot:m.124335 g.124335  ORF g.124335 m.124335 type:complete len:176 (-) comp13774_c0_seq2:366-893(-)
MAFVLRSTARRLASRQTMTAVPARSLIASMREGWLQVEETGSAKFQNIVSDGRHEILADEPTTIPGGTDTGANPYGYLLAALGTCTSMTCRMYATRKNLPLEKTRVILKHDRKWAKDCERVESEKGQVDIIKMEVEFVGDKLTDEDRAALLKIAHSCPVHKTLMSPTIIDVETFH